MNKFYITFLLVCSAIIAIFSIGATNIKKGDDRSKEIIFSHIYHIKEAGVDCIDCHKDVKESKSSSDNLLPKMATCYNCHDEKTTECGKCHADTLNFKSFDDPKRDFNYSHNLHLGLDSTNINCKVCHQGLEEVKYASQSEKALPDMDLCFGCHNNGIISNLEYVKTINTKNFAASKDCALCHTNLSNLKPKNHLVSDFSKSHSKQARVGMFDADCEKCHTNNFCQNCHSGSSLLSGKDNVSNATGDKATKPENLDDSKKMVLQNVHSLNYILNHGFDARTKKIECSTCHDQQTFCNDCHSGNNGGIRRKPKWHTPTGFTSIRRGNGGTHALYAKREIETCMSCHDTQGGDPICLMCHMDVDGVKGTDPKTHNRDFKTVGEGIWHSDDGAICFNCHVDIGAKTKKSGQGFCGYCHSKKS